MTILRTIESGLKEIFAQIDDIALNNQKKVLDAFRSNNVALRHFAPTTGYGYDDIGRECLGRVFASALNAEAAIVSPLLVSGTHAISTVLFGLLRPNNIMLSISGAPYDTLNDVIKGKNVGSLDEFGIGYREVGLTNNGFDKANIETNLTDNNVKVVYIQRSRGYNWRNALSVGDIGDIIKFVKSKRKDVIFVVDNCYGEFVEELEPTAVGADIIVGSLIKNIGAGIAPTGGYIAGKKCYVDVISYRLTAPSIGVEVGSYAADYRPFFEGLFLAPRVTANALKGAQMFAETFRTFGYDAIPSKNCAVSDIVCSIKFGDKSKLIDFCRAVQTASPIDSNLLLEPWDMPGYNEQVIMASGSFVQGSSIELSADAPIKEPYIAYVQGGLTYEHIFIALTEIISKLNLTL